jgi:uncharacterized repeat protein (TIGR01451 family)
MTHRGSTLPRVQRVARALTFGALAWSGLALPCSAQLPAPEPPGTAVVAPSGEAIPVAPVAAALPPYVQLVRFGGPEGIKVEVLGPQTEPIPLPTGDQGGVGTFGLRVGVGYQLRLSNLPDRPGAALYPMIEVVGHLHRPPGSDPTKFPLRVVFSVDDFEDAVARGRLVTEIVYLEDPDQAVPFSLPKDEIPIVTLSPSENPLKVAAALGRVMAVVRIGGRRPLPGDAIGAPIVDLAATPCPFAGPDSGRCVLPCGPVRGTAPPAGRPWLPKDEYLCDGGDRGAPLAFGGDGGLRGLDPRDAALRFQDAGRPRVLPTNMVCIYAPRFAAVRTSVGPNENLAIVVPRGAEALERQVTADARDVPTRMTQNQALEIARHRSRPSAAVARSAAANHFELRILGGLDSSTHIAGFVLAQRPETARNRQNAGTLVSKVFLQGVKSAESAVMTGIIQGAAEQVMAWKPQELAGVELPPNKAGMAVIKRVNVSEAEPGDVVTFVIQYRNMGNVPISAVSIVDSLQPRLEYVLRSAKGPAGTVFSATENKAGGQELRWDIGTVGPGAEGLVSFEARVR